MMLEAASFGKDPSRPEANEDALVILSDHVFAVIDGATDRNGTKMDGVLAGRFAAQRLRRALQEAFVNSTPLRFTGKSGAIRLIGQLTDALVRGYAENDVLEQALRDPLARAGASLVCAFVAGGSWHLISLGDCKVRVNGELVLDRARPVDLITAQMRRQAWLQLAKVSDTDIRLEMAKTVCWQGLDYLELALRDQIDPATLTGAVGRALAHLTLPPEEVKIMLSGGILHGQPAFQNADDRQMGYGCLDGLEVPPALIDAVSFPQAAVEQIEMFSDGYFAPPNAPGLALWEESHRRVEADDPDKLHRFLSTRGSRADRAADDRSYLNWAC